MTHAPFIIAAFAIAILTPLVLAVMAVLRRGAAKRLLQTIAEEKPAL
jgi:heme exporter protein D